MHKQGKGELSELNETGLNCQDAHTYTRILTHTHTNCIQVVYREVQ